jgi:hypothetical protein
MAIGEAGGKSAGNANVLVGLGVEGWRGKSAGNANVLVGLGVEGEECRRGRRRSRGLALPGVGMGERGR